jgi:hypothetical protein
MRGGFAVLAFALGCSAHDETASDSPDTAAIDSAIVDSATSDTVTMDTLVRDAPVVERKLLIKHGQDVPYPDWVGSHVATMDTMPFDGFVVTTKLSGSVQSQTALSRAAFDAELAPLKRAAFKNLTKNFVIIRTTAAGSWFGDHTTPANNFGVVSASARDAGLHGIVFDNEAYSGPVFNDTHCAGKPIAECRDRVRAVGKQTMSAMIGAWPDVVVLVFLGPYISEPKTATFFKGYFPYNDVSAANQTLTSFIVGMVEVTVGTTARVVDGGEIYTQRTLEQFERSYLWQKTELAKQSSLFPPTLDYPAAISVSFGVYDQPYLGATMSAAIFEPTIVNAMKRADRYVWLYTEKYDWWGTGFPATKVPVEWVDAVRRARAM